MNRARSFLKCFIFVELGSLFGKSLADYLHYRRYPKIYEMTSDVWYRDILFGVVFTFITVSLTLAAYIILGHIIKRKKKEGESE